MLPCIASAFPEAGCRGHRRGLISESAIPARGEAGLAQPQRSAEFQTEPLDAARDRGRSRRGGLPVAVAGGSRRKASQREKISLSGYSVRGDGRSEERR